MKFIRSPYVIALITVLGLFIVLPLNIPRHILTEEVLPHYFVESGTKYFTPDLDNDGRSEIVRFKTNIEGEPAFVIENHRFSPEYQKNLFGIIDASHQSVKFGDIQNNGLKDICFLNYRSDSMFVQIYESTNIVDSLRHTEVFIDTIQLPHPGKLGNQELCDIVDLDGDGIKEIIVILSAGFKIHPRGLYIYNSALDTVFSIPKQALRLQYKFSEDIDNDGKKEVFVNSKAVMNLAPTDSTQYNDYIGVFNVFTHNGELKYQTDISMEGNYAGVLSLPVRLRNDTCIIAVCYAADQPTYILSFNQDNVIDTLSIIGSKTDAPGLNFIKLEQFGKYIISDNTGSYYTFSENCQLETIRRPNGFMAYYKSTNLNSDPRLEHIVVRSNQEFAVMDHRFRLSNWITSAIPEENLHPFRFSEFLTDEGPKLFLQTSKTIHVFNYSINPNYLLRYPGFAGIYLLIVLLIYLIRYQQKRNWLNQQKIKEEIQVLQYRAINNQLNPHFSFNMLNVIGYSILNEEKEKAYQLLAKYSKLTRELVESSHQIKTTLVEEIEFIENYLELQKIRFEESFRYSIDIDPEVDPKLLIPKMIIHTFAENAIKHGLCISTDHKQLSIKAYPKGQTTIIEVNDNGIGYTNGLKADSDSTGKGFEILNQILGLFKKLTGTEVWYELKDIDQKHGQGTSVTIHITE